MLFILHHYSHTGLGFKDLWLCYFEYSAVSDGTKMVVHSPPAGCLSSHYALQPQRGQLNNIICCMIQQSKISLRARHCFLILLLELNKGPYRMMKSTTNLPLTSMGALISPSHNGDYNASLTKMRCPTDPSQHPQTSSAHNDVIIEDKVTSPQLH